MATSGILWQTETSLKVECMRIVPLLTAALVTGALWFLVMERDKVAGLAGAAQTPAPPDSAETAAEAQTIAAIPVVARIITAETVEDGILLRGRTEAARSVEIRSETTGRVISDPRRRGAFVNDGEVLCRLDPGTRPQVLAEAEARLAEAELGARNAERLSESGTVAETRRLTAQSALKSATAAVEAARRDLTRLEIRAPFSGLLEDDAAELGSLLQPGGLCARLIQLDPVRLVGFAAEADVDRIEVGALAGGRLASGGQVMGRVTFLARSADPATRTFRVEVTVPNPALTIRDGQTVELLIATEGRKAHRVPASALTLDDGGRLGVRLVDADSRVRFAAVSVLRDTDAGLWVTGLPDSAPVIVRGQEYVTEGVAVAVTLQEDAP